MSQLVRGRTPPAFRRALLRAAPPRWNGPHQRQRVNLLCFDYEPGAKRPRVVIRLAHEARAEHFRWEEALAAHQDEPVRYADFTVPVEPDFDAVLALLRAER